MRARCWCSGSRCSRHDENGTGQRLVHSDGMSTWKNEMQRARESRQTAQSLDKLRSVGHERRRSERSWARVRSSGGVECEHGSGGVVCEVVCEGCAVRTKALEVLHNMALSVSRRAGAAARRAQGNDGGGGGMRRGVRRGVRGVAHGHAQGEQHDEHKGTMEVEVACECGVRGGVEVA